jgi:hypothetical protein
MRRIRMQRKKRALASIIISILAITFVFSGFSTQSVGAVGSGTLAQTLNTVINNVNWNAGDSWTSNWAIILANQGNTAFDNAISQDVASGNYLDALYVARLAQLSGYSSDTVTQNTKLALEGIAMCGSLPITSNAHIYGDPDVLNTGAFLVYQRYALWGFQYAQNYGLGDKWNLNQAFTDFSKAYDRRPTASVSGEMLWCDPQENWAASYSSRYYDEHAETLGVFLKFAEQNVPNAMSYVDKAWAGIQTHWNNLYKYYGYTGTSTVECEMGNFAQLIAEYKDQSGGTIPYWDRVISDLNYKLLANGWSSPGWASPGVIIHAKGVNNQLRLWETMGATIALQTQYPYFTSTAKNSWQNMLMGSNPAWQGLMASSLNSGGHFSGVSGEAPSNDATVCAAATLFLYGIVPVTGNVNIPNREEFCNDQRTPFITSDFKFDYANQQIRIPVKAGQITFIYGSIPVIHDFTADGVYTIQFSSDWNALLSVNGQPIPTPTPTSTPTSTPTPTPTPAPTETPTPTPTPTPSPTPTPTSTPTPTPIPPTSTPTPKPTPTATPTPKSLTESVKTNKSTYQHNSPVIITITVKDASNGALLRGSAVDVNLINPSGTTVTTFHGTTSSAGTVQFIYQLHNSVRGTWTISSTASLNGYQNGVGQAMFTVT